MLLIIGSGQSILAPAVGVRAGVVVRKIIPGGAVGAVVLTHRGPLTLAEVRIRKSPGLLAVVLFLSAALFGTGTWAASFCH